MREGELKELKDEESQIEQRIEKMEGDFDDVQDRLEQIDREFNRHLRSELLGRSAPSRPCPAIGGTPASATPSPRGGRRR